MCSLQNVEDNSYLSTKELNPYKEDVTKLTRIISYLKNSIDICLTLEADNKISIAWYVDSSIVAHRELKSHAGAFMTLGKGCIIADSTKKNTRSSTRAELVAVDDKILKIVWIKHFIEHQGFESIPNVLHQYNQNMIKLQENRKESSGKRTCH